MCGIAAIVKSPELHWPAGALEAMRDEVAYRGPDDKGSVFLNVRGGRLEESVTGGDNWRVGLGHRRLSILDLSPSGHQPMQYGGTFWIVYNGEVYNYLELREELERLGHRFQSHSDTEVVLAAYAEWGTACFHRFRGMWGLVIVDSRRNEVILCRDRLGIKPLYIWKRNGLIAVASEIKQFQHVPGFVPRINHRAAMEYLQTSYEDPTETFFADVYPLQPGSWMKISLEDLKCGAAHSYWHPERIRVSVTTPEEAGVRFSQKLRESVSLHLRSDVPVGCALSGGLDSSSIVGIVNSIQNGEQNALHTFTSTFPGHHSDEREYVDAVLRTTASIPHFVTPSPDTFLGEMDRFLWIHDEPVGSFSMYAGYCVARLTRQCGVPVSLNGQGGDEIFSGYWQTYFMHLLDLFRKGRWLSVTEHFLRALLSTGNPALIGQVLPMLQRYWNRSRPKIHVKLNGACMRNPGGVVQEIMSLSEEARRIREIRVMFLPQLLKWEDRNSMAFSVEGRYPFLDHELIELCLSFAPDTLYMGGWTKYPLRLGLNDVLPSEVIQRRSKNGFETPQGSWLSSDLRPVLERWIQLDRPIWDIVDRREISGRVRQIWQTRGKDLDASLDVFRVFVFDRWLGLFGATS